MVSVSFFIIFGKITYNGLGLAEGGEIEAQMFSFALMPNRITNAQFTT